MSIQRIEIVYEDIVSPDLLMVLERQLVASAWEARKTAYAPYSNFHVGAAISTTDGQVFHGSNQENANFRVSCAESVVLNTVGAAGFRKKIIKIAVVGGPESLDPRIIPKEPEEPIAPCGQCRQDLKEVEDILGSPLVIIMASRNRVRRVVGIENLLPFAFGPASLK